MTKKFILDKKKKIIVGLISVTVLGGCVFAYRSYSIQAQYQKQEQSLIDIYNVAGKEKIFMSGKIVPKQSQELFVSAEQGELSTIKVSDGQYVQKGDLLFSCKNSAQVKEISDLNVQIGVKKKEKQSVIDEESKNAIDMEIKQLNSQVAILNKTAYQSVYAPFSGKIYLNDLSKVKEAGGSVMTLESTELYVSAQVNERDSYKINKGQSVELMSIATKEKYYGFIDKISDRPVDNSSENQDIYGNSGMTNYRVEISLKNQDNLKNGLNMQIVALHGSDDKKVPNTAIINEGSKSYVYKVRDGRALKTEIVKGEVQKEFTLVKSGVRENDAIIKDVQGRDIKDGDEVYSNRSELEN